MVVEMITQAAITVAAVGGLALAVAKWHRDGERRQEAAEAKREAEHKAEREADRKRMDAFMAELVSLRASVEGLERQQARDAEALGKRIDDLTRRMDDLTRRMDSMDTRLDSLGTRLAAVEREVAGLKAQFGAFRDFAMSGAAPARGARAGHVAEPAAEPAAGMQGAGPPRRQAKDAGPGAAGSPRP